RALERSELRAPATDIAYLQYTSGSTSRPKGARVSFANLAAHCEQLRKAFHLQRETVSAFWLPAHHSFGLVGGIVAPLTVGYRTVLMAPRHFLERPLRWLEAISRFGAHVSGGPNFAYDLCAQATANIDDDRFDLRHWNFAGVGGDVVRSETLRRFAGATKRWGFKETALKPSYGMSEATLTISIQSRALPPRTMTLDVAALGLGAVRAAAAAAPGTAREVVGVGTPIDGLQVLIVDPESATQSAEGQVGEIWLAGPNVVAGYWNADADAEAPFQARLSGGGERFLRTGDLGFIHEGELFITGRRKELIIVRGANFYPQDIETSVLGVSHQLKTAVAFSIDDDHSEQLVVLVERDGLGKQQELEARIAEAISLAHGLTCHDIVLLPLDSLARTASGKVSRVQAKAAYSSGRFSEISRASRPPQGPEAPGLAKLTELLATAMSSPAAQLRADRSLPALGVDSVALVTFLTAVRERFGVDLSPTQAFAADMSLAALARICGEQATSRSPVEPLAPARAIPSVSELSSSPASIGQQALYSLYRLDPSSSAYN
ncbi:MAG TPA: non-ribosomal peptide synthetase, partial [Polyangiaceae bacterium]